MNITTVLAHCIWAIDKLQPLIPDEKDWVSKANAIANYKNDAIELLAEQQSSQYPYIAKFKDTGDSFIPTMIDYENKCVWQQRSQASRDGDWWSFDEVILSKNRLYELT